MTLDEFGIILDLEGYGESYKKCISKICKSENIVIEHLMDNIDELIYEYTSGSKKELDHHKKYSNALKKYKAVSARGYRIPVKFKITGDDIIDEDIINSLDDVIQYLNSIPNVSSNDIKQVKIESVKIGCIEIIISVAKISYDIVKLIYNTLVVIRKIREYKNPDLEIKDFGLIGEAEAFVKLLIKLLTVIVNAKGKDGISRIQKRKKVEVNKDILERVIVFLKTLI